LAILARSWPPVDHSTTPLQPRHSPAQQALNELQAEMNRQGDPLVLVMSGADEAAVARLLDAASAHLAQAESNGTVRSFLLPTALWPHPDRQRANLISAEQFAVQASAMQVAVAKAGFNSNVLALTESLVGTWQSHRAATTAIWPTNQACRWLLKRAVARGAQDWVAAGMVQPGTNGLTTAALAKTDPGLPGAWLTGWTLLGEALLRHVEQRLWWLLAAMVVVVSLCLWLAFHRWSEVLLSFATLGFSVLVLLAVMSLAGWSWNLMNLMALPLLLGAGVDYTIHVQLALRRHGGDARTVRKVTGRAVFLCAATTVAGFGSNALSSNAGLASLGLVCSAGIAMVYFSSIWLLPAWWSVAGSKPGGHETDGPMASGPARTGPEREQAGSEVSAPSSFYRAWLWKLGLTVVRILPSCLLNGLCLCVAEIYHRLNRERREVVVQNLLPAVQGDRRAAEAKARQVFREMALKIADLWRFESGVLRHSWLNEQKDWDRFEAVHARGQGMLLITPHLGNWELGGPLLASHGYKLLVLTQPEPGGLTELRQASRAKWGIETLVVGGDGFAFVEIIKRLQAGEIVALLIDRPPPPSAVEVELFGRPFLASIAAAELARASGCALVGVTITRAGSGYTAHVLPEITYDRRALGNRAARHELTQQILRAFEPEIQQHLDQWYHFVPLWPDPPAPRGPAPE
jgi:lauroyl/myristoyl acyltransferase